MLPLGRVAGFAVSASWTLLPVAALAIAFLGPVRGLSAAALVLGALLAHELAHAAVAARRGLEVLGVELHLLGGAAKIRSASRAPEDELPVALAGPVVSAGLGVALGILFVATRSELAAFGAFINGALALTNLLPFFPFDGGRVLRAALAHRLGVLQATRVTARVGFVCAALALVVLIATGQWRSLQVAAFVLPVAWSVAAASLFEVRRAATRASLDALGITELAPAPWLRRAD